MRYLHSYLSSAEKILEQYKGVVPFSIYLKQYFSKEKKYGSKDRKSIAALCFNVFRTGAATAEKSMNERVMIALFLFTNTPNAVLQAYRAEWNEQVSLYMQEKALIAGIDVENIFPFNELLSSEINTTVFNLSFLQQPDLFIRIRPGYEEKVKQKLEAVNVTYRAESRYCLAFANGTKLEDIIAINKEAVIQDLNSQRTGELLELVKLSSKAKVWDCCAASGGKAIMALDLIPEILLTVSDVRESIIHNLNKRLAEAGIKNYRSFVADVANADQLKQRLGNELFDFVICDAPCSGSGTWARTPEQLCFFKKETIEQYVKLQKSIAMNAIVHLQSGGYFLYITCSVLRQENEDVVESILQYSTLSVVKQIYLEGYESKADSMFAALFRK